MKFGSRLMALGLLALFMGTVCVSGAAMATNTLIWPSRSNYVDWDPAATYSEETYILGNIYETLTFYEDGEVKPRLATSWEKSDGGATWTMRLREGVTFQDGTAFNAAAVKKSVMYTKESGRGASFLYAGLNDIETPDAYTAVFKFGYPVAFDLIASAQYGSYIIAPAAVDKGHDWMQAGNAIGTGPYKLTKVDPGKLIVLDKYDDYWGGWEDGQIDRVIQQIVFEASTRIQMLTSGEADLINAPLDQMKSLGELPNVDVAAGTSWRNSMFLFNVAKYPTDNKKFREALSYLWDYKSVLDNIYHGYGTMPVGPLPVSMWGHGEYDMPTYDPEHAMTLLEESGVPQKDWKISAMYIGSVGEYANSMELFQATAAQAGVEVELIPGEWGVVWDKAKKLETSANLMSMTWWPAYATPSDWLYSQYRTEENALFNLSFYSNPEFDAAVDAAAEAEGLGIEEATKKYIAAQDILMQDPPAIFMADVERVYAHSTSLTGMESQLNPAYETVFVYDFKK